MLYIVATPIGNLNDITLRALETLKAVDIIACEDTRHTSILLNHYQIQKPLLSFHSHSGAAKVEKILELLGSGKNIALVSDAGTPGISDPGYVVIQAALKHNIQIVPIPGPSAFLTALSASGLPTDKFVYLGFLPIKKGRQTLFKKITEEERTVVFYESPHRILKTLEAFENALPPTAHIVVAKELTKIYEKFYRGTPSQIIEQLTKDGIRGEYVVMIKNK
ncbi:16S rRNA (cytidine(1402)-2'-O)-methyltransferase [Candidatus Peregrinibacteria bacterium]|nr:16S rRNA (cytidine(1402)-2'-O)-methyltransferase [Candidatus Peregrinibacteria bacterium]